MKKEPWIDNVFKEKFESQEIDFNHSHWLQAEAMILADEKSKKKKRFIFWFLMAGLIGLSSLGFYQLSNHQPDKMTPESLETKQLIPDFRKEALPEHKPVTEPSSPNKTTESKTLSNNEIAANLSEPSKSKAHNSDELLKIKTNENNRIALKSNIAINDNSAYKMPIKNDKTRHTSSDNVKIELKQNETLSQNQNINQSTQFKDAAANSFESNNSVHLETVRTIEYLSELNNKILLIPEETSLSFINLNDIIDQPIIIKKQSWHEKGIRTSLAQQSVSGTNTSGLSQLGLEFYFNKSLSRNLFYGLSLGHLSNFNKEHYASVLTELKFQGFGAQENNYGVKPNWLQSAYLQLNGGVELKKHRLMVGARPEYLFATRGQVDQIKFTDPNKNKVLDAAQFKNINEGWLQTNLMNKLSFTAFAAYEYRVFNKLGVGIQINHTLASPYKPLQGGYTQTPLANWHTGFRLSYLLK